MARPGDDAGVPRGVLGGVAGDDDQRPSLALQRVEILFVLGGMACWRWGWWTLQCSRAMAYRYCKFPQACRREAEAAERSLGAVPEVVFLGTTYHEKPWITSVVFE